MDSRLNAAAQEEMLTALLVPIREGVATIGLLELLSRKSMVPDTALTTSLEAVALQLAHFSHLLRLGADPHWRLGRF